MRRTSCFNFFFLNDPATTEFYPLPLHAALPICDQFFRKLLPYMMGDSSVVFPAFELILVAKTLERIGDHATNIAEDVISLVQGQDIRHNIAEIGRAHV